MAGGGDDHVAGHETLLVKIPHRVALELLDRILGPQDGLAQRMIFPEILGEDFVDQVVGIVLVHLYFFEDDAALAADVIGIEHRIQHQVAEHLHGDGHVLVQHLDVEADTLLGGKSVHVAADGIDLARDLLRTAVLGPLEHHVLDEVRDAVPLQVFVPGPGLDPDPDRGGANVFHFLGNEDEPVGQNLAPYVADFLNHISIVAQRGRLRRMCG